MIHTLRSRLVAHLRTLSLRYFSNTSVGELIFRSINDARSIQEVMIFGFGTWATLALRIVLMAVFMAFLDPWLTLVALLVVPALAVTIRLLARRIQAESQTSRQHMGALTSHIEQTDGHDPRRPGVRRRRRRAGAARDHQHAVRAGPAASSGGPSSS